MILQLASIGSGLDWLFTVSRWCVGTAGMQLFIATAIGNLIIYISETRTPTGSSLILVVGGLCGSCAFAVLPIGGPIGALMPYFWLPLILDIGCLPLLILTAIQNFQERRNSNDDTD